MRKQYNRNNNSTVNSQLLCSNLIRYSTIVLLTDRETDRQPRKLFSSKIRTKVFITRTPKNCSKSFYFN